MEVFIHRDKTRENEKQSEEEWVNEKWKLENEPSQLLETYDNEYWNEL